MGERRDAYRILVGKHEGKKSLGRLRHKHGSIILKWIFKEWDGGTWTGLICLRMWTGGRIL
jgi:hypothetical protein